MQSLVRRRLDLWEPRMYRQRQIVHDNPGIHGLGPTDGTCLALFSGWQLSRSDLPMYLSTWHTDWAPTYLFDKVGRIE